jgi:phage terminase large subunit GpA-like protein
MRRARGGAAVSALDEQLVRVAISAARPQPFLRPSEWARLHVHLASPPAPRAGLYDPEVFPYLDDVMDSAADALTSGKNWLLMKAGQGGGSTAALIIWAWMQTYFPGPMLYLISKEEFADKFGKERVTPLIAGAEPLRSKFRPGRAGGETSTHKAFVDGSLDLMGGRSVLNMQTNPYRAGFIDEFDSLLDVIVGHGDPLKLLEVRTNAWSIFGPTLIAAFAHPSTRERGAGRVYYELSDQRRGHVSCPHCSTWFPILWSHVKVLAREGQSAAAAERDPRCYTYVTPCCGVVLTDGQRYRACRDVRQRSVLPPAIAADRRWVGVHFSNLHMTKPLVELAMEWIQGIDTPSVKTVVINKRLGDVDDQVAEQETTAEAWAELAKDGHELGTVPDGVQVLTSGQDSRLLDLHWAVWGWGLARTSGGQAILRGWLVDAGVEPGPAALDRMRRTLASSDLHVFDGVLYGRTWPRSSGADELRVEQGLHDSGWQPIAAYEYSQTQRGRAFPSKGMAEDGSSKPGPTTRWTSGLRWKVGTKDVVDEQAKRLDMNTFVLKVDLLGWPGQTFEDEAGVQRPRLVLAKDTPVELIAHLASERLVDEGGKKAWRKSGPNHWLDCAVMAYAAALQVIPFLKGKTWDERPALRRPARVAAPPRANRGEEDPWGREAAAWER